MTKCASNKKPYPTKEIAIDALIAAHTEFDYNRGKGPIAVYQCEDCGNFHFTSQGPMEPRLEQSMKTGTWQRQKDAQQWLNKLKKR